jgi:hypothetical protein
MGGSGAVGGLFDRGRGDGVSGDGMYELGYKE